MTNQTASQQQRNIDRANALDAAQGITEQTPAGYVLSNRRLQKQVEQLTAKLAAANERIAELLKAQENPYPIDWQSPELTIDDLRRLENHGRYEIDRLTATAEIERRLSVTPPAATADAAQSSERDSVTADIEAGREYLKRHPMSSLMNQNLAAGEIYNADK